MRKIPTAAISFTEAYTKTSLTTMFGNS